MKKCTKCGKEKNETEFYKDKRLKSGLQSNCKICQNEFRNLWRKRNPDKLRKNLKRYYENHKENWQIREKNMSMEQCEKKRIKSKEYYEKNKDFINQRKREKYTSIPIGEKKRYSQKYYENHKEEICKRSREHYKNFSDKQKKHNVERVKIWRQKNRQKIRAWSAVGNALLRGNMVKPNQCEFCMKKDVRLHAHHEDYEKPLEVLWLCHECHMKIHKNERKITN